MRILALLDRSRAADDICAGLEDEGLSVDRFEPGPDADRSIGAACHDCLLVDASLFGNEFRDGFRLASAGSNARPALILVDEHDPAAPGFGSDTPGSPRFRRSLVKPVSTQTVIDCVLAMIEPSTPQPEPVLATGNA